MNDIHDKSHTSLLQVNMQQRIQLSSCSLKVTFCLSSLSSAKWTIFGHVVDWFWPTDCMFDILLSLLRHS